MLPVPHRHQWNLLAMELLMDLRYTTQLQGTKKRKENEISPPRIVSTVLFPLGILSQLVNG